MKAVIMADNSNECMVSSLALTRLTLAVENLQVDEVIVTGRPALKDPLRSWHEKEGSRFSLPVTFRFYKATGHYCEGDPTIRLLGHEAVRDSALLVSSNGTMPVDLSELKKVLYLYPNLPLIGVKKPDHTPLRGAVSIGERNRITRFSSSHERCDNEWEPAGVYYFPERFLSDGIPAFVKSRTAFPPAFESFLSWSVRNFKIYAHVFAAHPGL